MKKLVLTLIILCLLAASLCACGGETPTQTSADVSSEAPVTSDGAETLGVPETADYSSEEFSILSAGNVAYADFAFF